MAKVKHAKEFVEPSFIHESLLCGYLWKNPHLFRKYKNHKITKATFTSDVWYFYYYLGNQMFESGIREFDDKTTYAFIVSMPKENGRKSWIDAYNSFGAYQTIQELMETCEKDSANDEYHLNEIQKYESLRSLELMGLIDTSDHQLVTNLTKMNLQQVQLFLMTKFKESFSHVNSGEVVEYDLVEGLEDVIQEMDAGEAFGLPLHNSPRLNRKIKGWKDGALYYLVISSGGGKSSLAMEKFVLGLFEGGEKALLAINEESNKKWQQLLLATVASNILKTPINRENMIVGGFDEAAFDKLRKAKEWAEQFKGHIKTIELKRYRIEDILSRVELYRPKGYNKLIIDTFKPDRSSGDLARWEAFSNSAQELHDLIKEDNYNVGTLATVQLKLGKETRYLDLDATGKSMEINEVASVVMMGRLLFADEYPGQRHALYCYNYEKDELSGQYYKKEYVLNPEKTYMVLFLSKNRFGSEEEQIIYEANYGINSFKEVGYTIVPRYGDK